MSKDRLQKILARAGIASRRKSEEYITGGRVRLNGRLVTELGSRADPATDLIEIEGHGRVEAERTAYILLHKPASVVTSMSDPERRTTVLDLLMQSRARGKRIFEGELPRVHPVGRLDYDTQGALVLTNDGELTHRLLHPKHHVPKTYMVKVQGSPNDAALERLRAGVYLGEPGRRGQGFRTKACDVRVAKHSPSNTWLEMSLNEGRNHQVKRMCEAVGHRVIRLIRTEFAGLEVDDLEPGAWRFLTREEVAGLKAW